MWLSRMYPRKAILLFPPRDGPWGVARRGAAAGNPRHGNLAWGRCSLATKQNSAVPKAVQDDGVLVLVMVLVLAMAMVMVMEGTMGAR